MSSNNQIKLVIITGLSGAGKTAALKYFEDSGCYCIDNLPSGLILNLIDFFYEQKSHIKKIAVAIDLRSGYFFEDIYKTIDILKKRNTQYSILFLEASKSAITKRYSLTRRKHPLVEDGYIGAGIDKEIEKMYKLREISDHIIDTTSLSPRELRSEITERMMSKSEKGSLMQISVVSFGYKYGIPENVDIIMDVRFLPNPYYIEGMKKLTGKDSKVVKYVISREETKKFLRLFEQMLDFLIPNYISEGKSYLGIGLGCTGGRHRSVAIAEKVYDYLRLKGYGVKIYHNDVEKGN